MNLSPDQVLNIAREALLQGTGNPSAIQCWYVLVDGTRVSPKWLVSQLTGLPVASFHSSEARLVLQQLDLEVMCE